MMKMGKISAAKKSYKNVKCSPQSATSCSWHREISIKKVRNEVIHFHENDEPQGTRKSLKTSLISRCIHKQQTMISRQQQKRMETIKMLTSTSKWNMQDYTTRELRWGKTFLPTFHFSLCWAHTKKYTLYLISSSQASSALKVEHENLQLVRIEFSFLILGGFCCYVGYERTWWNS